MNEKERQDKDVPKNVLKTYVAPTLMRFGPIALLSSKAFASTVAP